ncbi:MAG: hypothetical protein OJJ55_19125 [Rhodococcus sp.]|nr:hypothetical protein [Rhodococcus sp. (in: high G+C Gram-positive bacteria)]
MSDFHSEYVAYHEVSPDPMFGGCQNTKEEGTDGVVFNGVEPLVGAVFFLSRGTLVEAAAVLFNLTPAEVNDRLGASPPVPTVKQDEPKASQKRRKEPVLV